MVKIRTGFPGNSTKDAIIHAGRAAGVRIGIGLGAGLGVALGHFAAGVAIGMFAGLAVAIGLWRRGGRQRGERGSARP